MSNIPAVDPLLQKQNHALQFPLDNVTVLQKQSEHSRSWSDTALKLGQIISAIVILVVARLRHRQVPLELPFELVTFIAVTATIVRLTDSLLETHPVRRAFSPMLWFQMELRFTGYTALVYHLLSYCILTRTIFYNGLDIYLVAAAFGFVSAGLYVIDWWRSFSKRFEIMREM